MLELDFTSIKHTVSNHTASGMIDAAFCNIIFLSFMDSVQAHNVIFNWTKLCERVCYKANMVMSIIYESAGEKKKTTWNKQHRDIFFFFSFLVAGRENKRERNPH